MGAGEDRAKINAMFGHTEEDLERFAVKSSSPDFSEIDEAIQQVARLMGNSLEDVQKHIAKERAK